MSKICIKCEEEKEREDFLINTVVFGLVQKIEMNICKDCVKGLRQQFKSNIEFTKKWAKGRKRGDIDC